MSFRFIEDGPERGDCTAPYRIDLGNTPYTVEDFINEILTDHARDWGKITVYSPSGKAVYVARYKYGTLLGFPANNLMVFRIDHVFADGGWTRMDYSITVKTPEDFEKER